MNSVKLLLQSLKLGLLAVVVSLPLSFIIPNLPTVAITHAADLCKVGADGKITSPDPSKPCTLDGKICNDPNKVATDGCKTGDPAAEGGCTNGDCSTLIVNYVNPFIKLLTVLIGIIVTISIVYAGIQYSSSAGDPGKVGEAKKRITNSIIALIAYLLLFSFLQFLLPGGIV